MQDHLQADFADSGQQRHIQLPLPWCAGGIVTKCSTAHHEEAYRGRMGVRGGIAGLSVLRRETGNLGGIRETGGCGSVHGWRISAVGGMDCL